MGYAPRKIGRARGTLKLYHQRTMSRPRIDPLDLLGYVNPWTYSRLAWIAGRRGWSRLWRSPGPNSSFLIATSFTWSIAMALTDPFKALYLSKLGLSHLAIGGFFALDMGLRVGGVVLGGLFAQRWGHKFTLLLFDFISWSIACAVLALATEPWHVYAATCLMATNSMVSGSVMQLLVEDTPPERRTPMFALFSLVFVIPGLLLPALSGWMIERWGVLPVMRVLFGAVALGTAATTWWRRQRLAESRSLTPKADLGELMQDGLRTVEHMLRHPGFWQVLGIFLLSNCLINLNKAWQALYITEALGLGESWIGQMATAGSLAFVAVSLTWVPRLKSRGNGATFFWSSLLGAVPAVGLAWAQHPAVLLALGALGGLLGGIAGPLLSAQLASVFPPQREGLAQALLSSAMQLAVALSLLLGGALFETRFNAYPWVAGAMAVAMGALAWSLHRKTPEA